QYGKLFFDPGGRKITLNFALSTSTIIEPEALLKHFDPEYFIVKLTPVNPTYKAIKNKIQTLITTDSKEFEIKNRLEACGFEAILSIGEWEENRIGSNCGQYVQACENGGDKLTGAYYYMLT
ncbi:MAG: radical SAM protein, partial [Bacteroidales bacterium]|nr:radical SAM protein [Bacteroidales bacterium]